MKVKSLSRVQLLATPWTAAHQAPPSMGFSRQEYWSGVPLPSPELPLYLYGKPTDHIRMGLFLDSILFSFSVDVSLCRYHIVLTTVDSNLEVR